MRAAPAEQRPAARAGDAAVGRPARGGTREESIFLDEPGLRLDDLLATVVAVGGDVVAQVRLARGRVGRQLLRRQRVVRTTLAAAGGGNAGFLHSHGGTPEKTLSCLFVASSFPPAPRRGCPALPLRRTPASRAGSIPSPPRPA